MDDARHNVVVARQTTTVISLQDVDVSAFRRCRKLRHSSGHHEQFNKFYNVFTVYRSTLPGPLSSPQHAADGALSTCRSAILPDARPKFIRQQKTRNGARQSGVTTAQYITK